MPRGRPVKSFIRQNIVEILAVMDKAYGYQLHKIYNELFPPCTREVIYYNLKVGVRLKEFVLYEIKKEAGDFSWGQFAEKIYYRLGPNANPQREKRVQEWFQKYSKIT